jgi:hypothetical protein
MKFIVKMKTFKSFIALTFLTIISVVVNAQSNNWNPPFFGTAKRSKIAI